MKALGLTTGSVLLFATLGLAHASDSGSQGSPLVKTPATERAAANPYEANAEAVRAGHKLFERHCAECHGKDAGGTGWAPALIAASVRKAAPGELFWFLTNGDRRAGMPSWSRLPDARRWQIVAFLTAANASQKPVRP